MANSAAYFKEYNQKPGRKKKRTGRVTCPNCSTGCELQFKFFYFFPHDIKSFRV